MKAKNKTRSLIAVVATAVLSLSAGVFAVQANTASAEGYYYADEPAEVSLASQNVFTYIAGQGNIALATSGEMEPGYAGYFGGTVGSCKKENHDWNISENYAFMLDFSDTWTGDFFIELGHYDVAIYKETNTIVTGVGYRREAATTDAPGLSDLTGMQKVNVSNRVVYSDSAKTNPVGVQLSVTIGDSFSWSFDQIYTGHITCKSAHQYFIENCTGVALEYDLEVPVTYYYADEATEVSLASQNVFAYIAGQGNVALATSGEMEAGYAGYFGGTVGKAKTESHDWNLNENYAFMLDFSDTWTGSFFVELGHYDVAIHKETNQIVTGIGGGYQATTTDALGLSDLTGMQKVNVFNKVVYSNKAKTNPIGVQLNVTIGDSFAWSFDQIYTGHITCKSAHQYYFSNKTGVALEYDLEVPVTYYYADDATEKSYEEFVPNTKTWALDDAHPGNYYWEFNEAQVLPNSNYSAVMENVSQDFKNPTTTRSNNVTLWFNFSEDWGIVEASHTRIYDAEISDVENGVYNEYGYFDFSFGYVDISIHKDANLIKMAIGGRYALAEDAFVVEGLSDLSGWQKVNFIEKPFYSDKAKTTVAGVRYEVRVGDVTWSYDWAGFNWAQTRSYGFSAKSENGITMQGTVAKITEASISPAGDIGLNFKAVLPESTTAQTATFTREGKADLVVEGVKRDGLWVFTCPVAAKDYQEVVTMSLTTVSGETHTQAYSVEQYANALPTTSPAYALLEKVINYCEAARAFFAGETLEATADLTDEQLATLTASTLSGEQAGVSVKAATLVLETKTAINIYFTAESVEGLVCTVEGEEVAFEKVEGEDNLYVVKVANIAAQDLGTTYTVTIGGYTATYSAYSYAKTVLAMNSNANLVEVVKAMYFMGVAASAYFAK